MDFGLPRLRVRFARITQKYPEFLKKPKTYLDDLLEDLSSVAPDLYERCKVLAACAAPSIQELEHFMSDFKLMLAEKGLSVLNPNDELQLSKSISILAGVGEKTLEVLNDFGIYTVKDIIYNIPSRYEVLGSGAPGGKGVLTGSFVRSAVIKTKFGKQMFQGAFKTESGMFYCIWLHFNRQFPSSLLKPGNSYSFYGSVSNFNGAPAIFHPEILEDYELGTVRQVYSIPAKISQKSYQKVVSDALDKYLAYIGETLPESLRFCYKYPDIHDALNTLHFPQTPLNADFITSREHSAFKRMVFEELFYLQLRLLLRKSHYIRTGGISFDISKNMLNEIATIMPFRLTDDQRQALREILSDMRSSKQMNRLLQGDVGSGKTIVSFVAALCSVKNGYQAAILAPTEILAEQHFANLEIFLKNTGYYACLLTGSLKAKDKKALKDAVASGDIHFVVGTHAVIQEDVKFKNLGFAVIDEQHRFGVKQRKALMDKGFTPDILLMTATPIPRTLALTYYGDLELSEIKELPPGRIPPVTQVFRETQLNEAFRLVSEKLNDGDRAYFVYPAIDNSDKSNLKSVTRNYEVIKGFFKNKRVGLLHGKMKADEKSRLIAQFQTGDIDILVSTTVVEVGVDVKDATVIVIENADRFGLAQLHQLRGRVGRNTKQSYCILVASSEVSDVGFRRLRAMEQFTSGFKLAELDLELRGQGDFFGIKQSGIPEFEFADIIKDGDILKEARRKAEDIINEDGILELPKNRLIRSVLMQRWQDEYELFLVG